MSSSQTFTGTGRVKLELALVKAGIVTDFVLIPIALKSVLSVPR